VKNFPTDEMGGGKGESSRKEGERLEKDTTKMAFQQKVNELGQVADAWMLGRKKEWGKEGIGRRVLFKKRRGF